MSTNDNSCTKGVRIGTFPPRNFPGRETDAIAAVTSLDFLDSLKVEMKEGRGMFEGRGALYENPIQKDHPKWCVNQLTVGVKSRTHSRVHN